MTIKKVKKHWVVLGNNWHLLVDVFGNVFHKTVIIYDTRPGFESSLETNKLLNEHDLVEEIQRKTGVFVELIYE